MSSEGGFAPASACIVGGRGRMGRWLAPRLAAAGITVSVADDADGPWDSAAAARAELVVLAVPVAEVAGVARRLGPHLAPSSLVMDLASLKAGPLAAMVEHCPCPVVGCHPLFGPDAGSARGQVVFLCPGRGAAAYAWARSFWRDLGAHVREIPPERHDRLMAQVQSLRHLTLAAVGLALAGSGFDPGRELAMAGPWTGELLDMLGRQARQPAGLYAGLAAQNPHAPELLEELAHIMMDMAGRLRAGDTAGLEKMIEGGQTLMAGRNSLLLDRRLALG